MLLVILLFVLLVGAIIFLLTHEDKYTKQLRLIRQREKIAFPIQDKYLPKINQALAERDVEKAQRLSDEMREEMQQKLQEANLV